MAALQWRCQPGRSLVGQGEISLKEARVKAQEWLAMLARDEDPAKVERRRRRVKREQEDTTFEKVMEEFLKRHVRGKLRSADDIEREMRRDLLPLWKDLPLHEITRRDVIKMIDGIKDRGSPGTARIVLGHAKVFFNWAIEKCYVETSPCAQIKPARLIGKKVPRERVLTDAEIKAFWNATGKIDYPMGPLLRMILMTGSRRNEVSDARWHEVNLKDRLFTVPPERFKSDTTNIVPLTADMMALLETLPRWNSGDALFSATYGVKPATAFSMYKIKIDDMMREELSGELKPWVIHDLRRTVRTRLAELRIPDHVAEMIIGHGRKGLQRVYDHHKYADEKREALEAWNARLREIVA
jgi:integrase